MYLLWAQWQFLEKTTPTLFLLVFFHPFFFSLSRLPLSSLSFFIVYFPSKSKGIFLEIATLYKSSVYTKKYSLLRPLKSSRNTNRLNRAKNPAKGALANFKSRVENVQGECGSACPSKQQRNRPRPLGSCNRTQACGLGQ